MIVVNVTNPCQVNNGGCSHLCLLAPVGGVNCACPTGRKLKPDNLMCAEGELNMFLLRQIFNVSSQVSNVSSSHGQVSAYLKEAGSLLHRYICDQA